MKSGIDLIEYVREILSPLGVGREAAPGWTFTEIHVAADCVELVFHGPPENKAFKLVLEEKDPARPSVFSSLNFNASYVEPGGGAEVPADLKFLLEFQIKKKDDLPPETFREAWRKTFAPPLTGTDVNLTERLDELKRITPPAGASFHLVLKSECVNRCVFCAGANDPRHRLREGFTTAEYEAIMGLNKVYDLKRIILSGNEVLARGDIFDLVSAARGAGFSDVEVQTSGFGLHDPAFAEGLVGAGVTVISVPIYAAAAAVHDSIVGRPGAFAELKSALASLAALPLKRVNLYTLLLKQNLPGIVPLIETCGREFRGFPHSFNTVRPYSDDPAVFAEVAPAYSDIAAAAPNEKVIRVLPFCVIKEHFRDFPLSPLIDERREGRAREIRINDLIFGRSIGEIEKRRPVGKCAACSIAAACNFPFAQYVELYGDVELEAFA